MLKNYFVTAVRTLLRDKTTSVVNIGGLAIGLATVIMIALFVKDEFSYDRFWADAERLYRVDSLVMVPDRPMRSNGRIPSSVRDALVKDFPEIETAVRVINRERVVKNGDDVFFEQISAVDPNFFDIFDLRVLAGNGSTALESVTSVVLTERMAIKYFGSVDAIGETFEITQRLDSIPGTYTVGAVIENPPLNSHFDTDILLAINPVDYLHADGQNGLYDWTTYRSFYAHTYLRLASGINTAAMESQFDPFIARNAPSHFSQHLAYEPDVYFDFRLIPITDIYLRGPETGRIKPGGDLMTVYSFIAIAMLLLLISTINFINLSLAKSVLRAREISLRKILGASRNDIIRQFMGETALTVGLALILALMLVFIVIPAFNQLLSTFIGRDYLSDPVFQFGILSLMIVVVIASGFYPSFVLSRHRPADALRSRSPSGLYGGHLRSIFATLQFAISIALIVSTTVIYQQTRYARSMDLGYESDQVLVLRGINDSPESAQTDTLRQRITAHPEISSIAFSNSVPFDERNGLNDFYRLDIDPDAPHMIPTRYIDQDYFRTYGVDVLVGRDFDENHRLDPTTLRNDDGTLLEVESAAVLNLAALRVLGFEQPEDALDMVLGFGHGRNSRTVRVVGVVPDLKLKPAMIADEPNVFIWAPFLWRSASIRYNSDQPLNIYEFVASTWADLVPNRPLKASYLSNQINAAYNGAELRFKMLAVFSSLAIIISSLGLYALASFDVQRRTLEIGIRKVLGATTGRITRLLLLEFSKPVLAANLFAWPIAWFLMSDWLESYAYRIELSPIYFLGAGLMALFIAWCTVGAQAYNIARKNPIHALRYE